VVPRFALWVAILAILGVPASASDADAAAISANIQARHFPFGTVTDPIFASPSSDQIVGYTRCGDSAIWTGHYLAAEAFRYNVTHSADALANATKAIAGIKMLLDVTGTDLLARCAVPVNSPYLAGIEGEEAHNGIHTNNSMGLVWIGNTSRDQYSGVMFGLSTAYDLIDDPTVQSNAAALITRIVNYLVGRLWTVVMPDGSVSTTFIGRPDQQLSFLQVAHHVNSHFSVTYDASSVFMAAAVATPIAYDALSDDSYYKFNLDYINLYDLLRLENGPNGSLYRASYAILRNHTASHQNAFFDVIDRALNGPNPARDAEMTALLSQWIQRPRRNFSVDLSDTVPVCGDQACEPVPVPLRPPTDFLWQRSPFQLAGGGSGTIESAGIDYILPYWMARYYGALTPFTVQSAAAPTTAVAANSLASAFGSALSSETGEAATLPWPATLGGVTVDVKDSAGVTRPAVLTYVSQAQINFLIPQGTASGTATVIVANGGSTISAPVTIASTAPTLFAMSGNGSGVAAATATSVQASDPTLQDAVPVFECASGGCASVPIDLGVDTAVYAAFYGTGIRNRSSLAGVTVTIHGVSVPVLYAGPQPEYPGLDQVNVQLPLALRGSGESNVVLTVDGRAANPVTINIR
jgi:uncharacterized protein (TIGR03437 family)